MSTNDKAPDLSELTTRGASAWAGVDAQELRTGVAKQTAVAWIVRIDGSHGERPLIHYSEADALAHAAVFRHGLARVVALVEQST